MRLAVIYGFMAQYPTAVQILYSYKFIYKRWFKYDRD